MYPMVNWKVTSLQGKMGLYIKRCRVRDAGASATSGLKIIDESCYAKVVKAKPTGNSASSKFVSQQSSFEYMSFSYNTAGINRQILTCEVEFCIIENNTP